MKNIFLVTLVSLFIFSCGGKKEKVIDSDVVADNYSIAIDAVYEKNDSLLFIYAQDGSLKFEKVKGMAVKGSPLIQRLVFNFPAGDKVENVGITMSQNKDQKTLVVKAITIKNNDKEIIGSKDNYLTYFQADEGFTWNVKETRYDLNHDKKYPPSLMGSEALKTALSK